MKVKIQLGPGSKGGKIWIDDEEWSQVTAVEVRASVNDVTRVVLTLLPSSVEIEGEVDALEQGPAAPRPPMTSRPR